MEEMKEFDPKSLEKFNGRDGSSCYVAVDGKVYDISESDLWAGGRHMDTHSAGRDLGESIKKAPHEKKVLERFPQIGVLITSSNTDNEAKPPPAIISLLLKQHPHPITVHFPQALLSLAPLFLVLFYLTGNAHFERTCYYLGVTGLLAGVPAILTGFLHWVFKYGRSTKSLYLFKITVSLLLFVYTAVVMYFHTARGVLPADPPDLLMLVLYLIIIPLAVVTGHTGGKIVFG